MSVSTVAVYRFAAALHIAVPLFSSRVPAGFPSPADDYIDRSLDLHEHLVKHPAATFFVRVAGDSMVGAGIHDGDLLIVDRSLEPAAGKIVVAVLDGELTVKRVRLDAGRLLLMPENTSFAALEVSDCADFQVWGVVTSVIHKL